MIELFMLLLEEFTEYQELRLAGKETTKLKFFAKVAKKIIKLKIKRKIINPSKKVNKKRKSFFKNPIKHLLKKGIKTYRQKIKKIKKDNKIVYDLYAGPVRKKRLIEDIQIKSRVLGDLYNDSNEILKNTKSRHTIKESHKESGRNKDFLKGFNETELGSMQTMLNNELKELGLSKKDIDKMQFQNDETTSVKDRASVNKKYNSVVKKASYNKYMQDWRDHFYNKYIDTHGEGWADNIWGQIETNKTYSWFNKKH